jgi:hypothetical protein
MASGDSHTNFDAGAFTVGAIGGAATIAGAIGAGISNLAAARRERGTMDAVQSRDDTIRWLERRIDNQRTELGRRDATICDEAMTIRELGLRLGMSQYLRRQGR